MLVIEDDGGEQFKFSLAGDIERIGKLKLMEYSAAEYWGAEVYAALQQMINDRQLGSVKKLNRKDRRANAGQ